MRKKIDCDLIISMLNTICGDVCSKANDIYPSRRTKDEREQLQGIIDGINDTMGRVMKYERDFCKKTV